MLNAIRIAIVVVVMLAHIDNGSCEKEAMLSMELIGYGFHRELKYIVIFPGQQGEDRPFNIHQTLPAGVYIDKNQLDDLKRNGKLNYHLQRYYINTERTSEESDEFGMDLYGNAAHLDTITFPIHFRYHGATHNKSFMNVQINYPTLFLKVVPEVGASVKVTEQEKAQSELRVCDHLKRLCRWAPVDYDNQSRKSIGANIPVGNKCLSGLVSYITIGLSWLAGIFLFCLLYLKMRGLLPRLSGRPTKAEAKKSE